MIQKLNKFFRLRPTRFASPKLRPTFITNTSITKTVVTEIIITKTVITEASVTKAFITKSLALIFGPIFIPGDRPRGPLPRFDWSSYILLCITLCCIISILSNSQRWGWDSNIMIYTILIGLATGIWFIKIQTKKKVKKVKSKSVSKPKIKAISKVKEEAAEAREKMALKYATKDNLV